MSSSMDTTTTPAVVTATTSNGAMVDSLTASMTIPSSFTTTRTTINEDNDYNDEKSSSSKKGTGGYVLLQDFTLLDTISHFDRERIPERVVHAKGAGASGYFVVTKTEYGTKYCKASIFQSKYIGQQIPITVRFSTVGGENGSADTVRDPRGFAIKFFTPNDGIWDLVGNNTPIFFIRDPILFPSFIHTQKRNPVTHCKDANMMWDFISLRHETCHQVSFLFSDRGIPNGYRHMNGYGSHTYKNVNNNNEPYYVKYHWKTNQGIQNLTTKFAGELSSNDPDYSIRDLYNAIDTKNYPSWTMYVQIMTYTQAQECSYNPFDLTKVWSHIDYPLIEIGYFVLNKNPINYYVDIEQLAFSPSNMIRGIEPSPDKMLQVRLFSYPDTHRHRLGTNYQYLPCNVHDTKISPLSTYQRDGPMQFTNNGSNQPNYYPNSFNGPQPNIHSSSPNGTQKNNSNSPKSIIVESIPIVGVDKSDSRVSANNYSNNSIIDIVRTDTGDEDNYTQCTQFFNTVLNNNERERLTSNIAVSLCDVTYPIIQQRVISMFTKVHVQYGIMIQTKLNELLLEKEKQNLNNNATNYYSSPASLNPPRNIPTTSTAYECPYGYGKRSNL